MSAMASQNTVLLVVYSTVNCLFRRRSKKTSKLRITSLCAGNSPVTGDFSAQGPVTRKIFHLMTSSWTGVDAILHKVINMMLRFFYEPGKKVPNHIKPTDWYVNNFLTFLVLKLEYTARTRSISWLLMTWLLVSPGHQQLRFWLTICMINRFL